MDRLEGAVAGFVPSVHGLHFANRFPAGPTVKLGVLDPRWVGVGDATAGLCGGVRAATAGLCGGRSWLVRERFEAGQPIPGDTTAPANGSPLFQSIVRRQVQSLEWLRGPLRFWWVGLRGGDRARQQSLRTDLPRIGPTIEPGRLALRPLVRRTAWNPWHLSASHTVVA